MYAVDFFARPALGADQLAATALKLSTFRRKTIDRLTVEQPQLRRAATALRLKARGHKLGRRLRRKGQLGMAGAF